MSQSMEQLKVELEAMVDRTALDKVLQALADVCRDKAEHVRTAWGDRALAKEWNEDARRLDACAAKINGGS